MSLLTLFYILGKALKFGFMIWLDIYGSFTSRVFTMTRVVTQCINRSDLLTSSFSWTSTSTHEHSLFFLNHLPNITGTLMTWFHFSEGSSELMILFTWTRISLGWTLHMILKGNLTSKVDYIILVLTFINDFRMIWVLPSSSHIIIVFLHIFNNLCIIILKDSSWHYRSIKWTNSLSLLFIWILNGIWGSWTS
jgi:hypothetical protein